MLAGLPCLSTVGCELPPPSAGPTSKVVATPNTVDPALLDTATYTCSETASVFLSEAVNYAASFVVGCSPGLILGGMFPYWAVTGTDYPDTPDLVGGAQSCFPATTTSGMQVCLNARECREKPDLGNKLGNTFDQVNYVIEDQYEYYCHTEGNKGWYRSAYLLLRLALAYSRILTSVHAKFETDGEQGNSLEQLYGNNSTVLAFRYNEVQNQSSM